jgi:hypothetical protein
MNKILLREYFNGDLKITHGGDEGLNESQGIGSKVTHSDKGIFVEGIIQCADKTNGNNRIYPRHVLEREMDKYSQLVKSKRSMGELDHPQEPIVSLANVSHYLVDYWWQGDHVMGKFKICEHTDAGRNLKGLFMEGLQVAVSSRALGSLTERNGNLIVGDDLDLKCFDMVHHPSTDEAYMFLSESKSYKNYYGLESIPQQIYNIKKILGDKK